MSRRGRGLGSALAASLLLHAAVGLLAWFARSSAAALPEMRVYAVDIVSPPPQRAGEPAEPVTAPAEEEPQPEPEPELEPEPTPPRSEPEPSPAPPTRKDPEPAKPRPSPPRETPRNDPAPPRQPRTETPTPSTGRNPDPTSEGGEDLDVQLKGVQCPSPAYCENIIRQLHRYFRPPADARRDHAEVFFYINQDGSVSDIRVIESAGSFRFRLAAVEAVEQAGNARAFGALPRSFSLDRLPVSFYFRPTR